MNRFPFHRLHHGLLALLLAMGPACGLVHAAEPPVKLTNVSYAPTREMYQEYNVAFARYWRGKTGQSVEIAQTHGNSSNQASAVNNGQDADVVTLAMAFDIDAIASNGIVPPSWQSRMPQNSSPYVSTIVFLVRKGNPKNIRDWNDLVRWGVNVVIPNPKTAGAARWAYLAGWGYAMKQPGGNEERARTFLKRMYANTKVMDYNAPSATSTFTKRNLGDVLVSWENEALKALSEEPDRFEIVVPSISILAEPPVTVVDRVVDKRGTRKVAEAYLQYLYSPEGQDIAAKYFYRPTDPAIAAKYVKQFPPLKLFKLEELFGNWQAAHKVHFKDGAIFDEVYDQYRNAS